MKIIYDINNDNYRRDKSNIKNNFYYVYIIVIRHIIT